MKGACLPKSEAQSEGMQLSTVSLPDSATIKDSFIIRAATDDDVECAAQICQDAFGAFNASFAQPNTFPPRDQEDISKQIAVRKLSHPHINYVMAVTVDGEKNELEVIGANGIDLRDSIGGIGVLTVKPTSQACGVGRALMKAVMEFGESENGLETMSLTVDSMNCAAFALYTSLGFKVVEFCAWISGLVSDEEEERVLQRAKASGVTIRKMMADDVLDCNRLFEGSFGFSRINSIRDSQADECHDTAIVATRAGGDGGEEVVGYAAAVNAGGHCLAQNEEILKAMMAFGSKLLKSNDGSSSLTLHIMLRHNPSVLNWALKARLRIRRHFIWMYRGKPITFDVGLAYCPDYYY